MPLRPEDPETLGPYRLYGRLGQGGMGTVYLAGKGSGRPVALKIVREVHTRREGFAERFRAEVTSARRVSSFCTSRVLDDGTAEDGRPYLVTEYIPGISLDKWIRASGALMRAPGSCAGGWTTNRICPSCCGDGRSFIAFAASWTKRGSFRSSSWRWPSGGRILR